MRVNIDLDEHIVATLPKIWGYELGFMGFFNKSKEGILALTNKQIIFIPEWVFVTPKERNKNTLVRTKPRSPEWMVIQKLNSMRI